MGESRDCGGGWSELPADKTNVGMFHFLTIFRKIFFFSPFLSLSCFSCNFTFRAFPSSFCARLLNLATNTFFQICRAINGLLICFSRLFSKLQRSLLLLG